MDVKIVTVYVDRENKGEVRCPECGRKKTFSLEKYSNEIYDNPTIRATCKCGGSFDISFKRRRFPRKRTSIRGAYAKGSISATVRSHVFPKNPDGLIIIENLSRGGLGFTIDDTNNVQKNSILKIKFTLDDGSDAVICANVDVRHINGRYVGARFCDLIEYEKRALGRYLSP